MNPTCSICLDDVLKEEEHKLECSHVLHQNCYSSLMRSPANKKCPMCRCDILKNLNICMICNGEMNLDPNECEILRATDCNCLFHFHCLKQRRSIYCLRCDKNINTENVEALTYYRFETSHLKWIGPFNKCKIPGCKHNGNPGKFGYCDLHNESKSTNKAIILAYAYFIKFIYEDEPGNRASIFINLIEYMNSYHRLDDIEEVDFDNVRRKINKCNILHN